MTLPPFSSDDSGHHPSRQLRLARFFGTSERFWLNLQTGYDLEVERDRLRTRLSKEVRVLKRAS